MHEQRRGKETRKSKGRKALEEFLLPVINGSGKGYEETSINKSVPKENWEVVKSPAKSRRRGNKEVGVETIISSSRFATLSDTEIGLENSVEHEEVF